jgi:hypothetical protein
VLAGLEDPGTGNHDNSFFKIYPNPTPGKFTGIKPSYYREHIMTNPSQPSDDTLAN